MQMKVLASLVLLSALLSCSSSEKSTDRVPEIQQRSRQAGFVDVNGLHMYYEIHGEGKPLVLLHGGGSSIEVDFGRAIPELSKSRKVVAFDEQAHGRTADIDRPTSFRQTADDVSKALEILKIPKADVIGFSNGGTTALELASRYPDKVDKLIVASAIFKKSGAPTELWKFIKSGTIDFMPAELKSAFLKINPDPAKLQRMYERDTARMNAFKDIPIKQIRSIRAQTLVMAGDQDVPTLEHTIEISKTIPGARLFILPGGHDAYLGNLTSAAKESRLPIASLAVIEEFLSMPRQQP